MKILAIETSCDETAISVVEAKGAPAAGGPRFGILSNVVASQVKLHAKWGGVVPNLAKREHAKNLIPVLEKSLKQAGLLEKRKRATAIPPDKLKKINKIFEREPELLKRFLDFIPTVKIPGVDAVAVTVGPGLEPALWVGINFAKALSEIWGKPIVPVNHMEGHILSVLLKEKSNLKNQISKTMGFPALALLVSGGHTELVLMKDWLKYKIVGQTRDDAVGEAFDKVARILGLPYPGGPEIAAKATQISNSKFSRSPLASPKAMSGEVISDIKLPRPMMNSGDFDFSFSGLKTATLYLIKDLSETKKNGSRRISPPAAGGVRPQEGLFLGEAIIAAICHEFQQAAIEVLISKTIGAAKKYGAKTVILGGGVAANKELRNRLKKAVKENLPDSLFLVPPPKFTTDNAAMIAAAAYFRAMAGQPARRQGGFAKNPANLKANGNLTLK